MSEPLRIGLIGAGRWGRAYINTIPLVPGAVLSYVASNNPETETLVRKTTRVLKDWKELVFAYDVDAVVIAAPASLQPEMAAAAFAAGKHVLLEKPLALEPAAARAILEGAKKAKVHAAVDHVLLHHPAYVELSTRLAGKPVTSLKAWVRNQGPYRMDAPALWDYGSHPIYIALDLFGREPEKAEKTLEKDDGKGQNWKIDLSFGKVKAELHAGNANDKKECRFEIESGKKTFVFDDLSPHKLVENGHPVAVDADKPLNRVVEAFVAGCKNPPGDLDGVELGVRVVETLARLDR